MARWDVGIAGGCPILPSATALEAFQADHVELCRLGEKMGAVRHRHNHLSVRNARFILIGCRRRAVIDGSSSTREAEPALPPAPVTNILSPSETVRL
jgi:hypothetical protein